MNCQENRDGISEYKEKQHYQHSFLFLSKRSDVWELTEK